MVNRRDQMPIRVGCFVSFVQNFRNGSSRLVEGYVVEDSYINGYHSFTIARKNNRRWKTTVSGAYLYKNILEHVPSEKSKIDRRRACKKGIKAKRRRRKRQPRRRNTDIWGIYE